MKYQLLYKRFVCSPEEEISLYSMFTAGKLQIQLSGPVGPFIHCMEELYLFPIWRKPEYITGPLKISGSMGTVQKSCVCFNFGFACSIKAFFALYAYFYMPITVCSRCFENYYFRFTWEPLIITMGFHMAVIHTVCIYTATIEWMSTGTMLLLRINHHRHYFCGHIWI